MRKNGLLVVIVIVVLLLGACTRSASEAPSEATPDSDGQLDLILADVATQTAQVEMGGGANATDEAAFAGATPVVVVTAVPTSVPPTPTVPAVDLTVPKNYKLRKGEFPYCIARRFDIDIDTLLAASGLAKGSVYSEGQLLKIPTDAKAFQGTRALQTHPADYTVQAGDTYFTIACKFGNVYPEQIAAANGQKVNQRPKTGAVIQIP